MQEYNIRGGSTTLMTEYVLPFTRVDDDKGQAIAIRRHDGTVVTFADLCAINEKLTKDLFNLYERRNTGHFEYAEVRDQRYPLQSDIAWYTAIGMTFKAGLGPWKC